MVLQDGYEKWEALNGEDSALALFDGDWRQEHRDLKDASAATIQQWYRRRMGSWRACAPARAALAALAAERARRLARLEEERRILAGRKEAETRRQLDRVEQLLRRRAHQKGRRAERDAMIRRHANIAEAERRFFARHEDLVRRAVRCWKIEVSVTKFRLGAARFMLLQYLHPWGRLGRERLRRRRAAVRLQSLWRVRLARRRVGRLGETRALLERLFARGAENRGKRAAVRQFYAWRGWARQMKQVKRIRKGALKLEAAGRLQQWQQYLVYRRGAKAAAAGVLQAGGRGMLGRRRARRRRRERAAATKIQTLPRGFLARRRAAELRERRGVVDQGVAGLLAKSGFGLCRRIFSAWKRRAFQMRQVRAGARRHELRHQARRLASWKEAVSMERLKREKRRAREAAAALAIQRVYRGHVGRLWFRYFDDREKAAVAIQKVWRGYCTRWHYQAYLAAWRSAVAVQRVWRGHAARRRLGARWRGELLDAAEENRYDRLLFMFTNFGAWAAAEADDDGNNALHRAARGAAKRTLKLCLRMGMDANLYNGRGRTPLHLAVRSARAPQRDAVAAYLAGHGAWLEAPDHDGATPLCLAARLGRALAAQALLEEGAEPEACDHEGRTPLLAAAAGGHAPAVAVLLRYGANPHVVGPRGFAPLHEAALADGEALAGGDQDGLACRHLLAAGADPEAADDEGMTPLMLAAGAGRAGAAAALAEAGADAGARDARGRAPLHLAAVEGHHEVVHALASCGSLDLDAVDAEGDTALLVAAGLGHAEVARTLLEYGADPNKLNAEGDTAVHVACRAGDPATVAAMVAYELDLARRNWEELTPLGVARMNNRLEVVDLLERTFAPEDLGELEEEGPPGAAGEEEGALVAAAAAARPTWEVTEDPATGQRLYVNLETGEARPTTPELAGGETLGAAGAAFQRPRRRRVQPEVGAGDVGLAEYQEYQARERREADELKAQWAAAVVVQKYWRRTYCKNLRRRLARETAAARALQRLHRRRARARREAEAAAAAAAATAIQRTVRGHLWRGHFARALHAELWWARAERILAYEGQRVWRGYLARRRCRKLAARRRHGQMQRADWKRLREENLPFRRVWEMFEELVLAGTCDTTFYFNRVTEQGSWDKPQAWAAADNLAWLEGQELARQGFTTREARAARRFQALWRAKQARRAFQLILKAKRLMETCEDRYLEDPDSIVHLCNYAIYLHAMRHDYDRVRPLYIKAMEFMRRRGPDNAFILYSYALFGAATFEEDWGTVRELVRRARLEDPRRRKYLLADRGFFRMAAVALLQDGEAWHNYALCQHLVFENTHEAEKAFVRAVERAPHAHKIEENFNTFIRETRPGSGLLAHDIITEHNRRQVVRADEHLNALYAAALADPRFPAAAIVIQRMWRNHMGQFKFASLAMFKAAQRNIIRQVEQGDLADASPPLGGEGEGREGSLPLLEGEGEGLDKVLSPELLALGWERVEGENGEVFYYNGATGASTWDRPLSAEASLDGAAPPPPLLLTAGGGGEGGGGRVAAAAAAAEEGGGEGEGGQALPTARWEEGRDQEGRTYYYNSDTGESTYEKPIEYMKEESTQQLAQLSVEGTETTEWEQTEDEEGNSYWYNSATGETSWEPPSSTLLLAEALGGGGEDEPGGGEWAEVEGEDGKAYYYNEATGETRWDLPPVVRQQRNNLRGASSSSLGGGSPVSPKGGAGRLTGRRVVTPPRTGRSASSGSLSAGGAGGPPLPAGWEAADDADTGRAYYYNAATGETSWHRPLAADGGEEGGGLNERGEVVAADGDVWEECVDDGGAVFYYNNSTGESTWDRPVGGGREDELTTATELENGLAGPSSSRVMDAAAWSSAGEGGGEEGLQEHDGAVALPEGWESVWDEETGQEYFYHTKTGETVWERPLG